MNPTSRSKKFVYLLLVCMTVVWGLSWPVSKIALQYTSPLTFVADRLVIGTICTFIFVAFLGKLIWPKRQDIPLIVAIGILQIALFMFLANLGLEYVDAGRSAILVYTTPIWVTPIAIIFFGEHAGLFKWLGLLFGVCGIVVLFGPWGIDWHDKTALFGNMILLLCAICWAIAILVSRHMRTSRSSLELIPWQLLVGLLPVIGIAYWKNAILPTHWTVPLIYSLLYTGIFATAFAYWATVVISRELSSITTSLSFLAVPMMGIIFSAVMLHEPITWLIISALLLIICGLVCVSIDGIKQRRKDKNSK